MLFLFQPFPFACNSLCISIWGLVAFHACGWPLYLCMGGLPVLHRAISFISMWQEFVVRVAEGTLTVCQSMRAVGPSCMRLSPMQACARATTTYLVNRRIDMLPKPLTEDICSLRYAARDFGAHARLMHDNTSVLERHMTAHTNSFNYTHWPQRIDLNQIKRHGIMHSKQLHSLCCRGEMERLTFSVLWEMTPDAQILSTSFTRAVIKSRAALTYQQAQVCMLAHIGRAALGRVCSCPVVEDGGRLSWLEGLLPGLWPPRMLHRVLTLHTYIQLSDHSLAKTCSGHIGLDTAADITSPAQTSLFDCSCANESSSSKPASYDVHIVFRPISRLHTLHQVAHRSDLLAATCVPCLPVGAH